MSEPTRQDWALKAATEVLNEEHEYRIKSLQLSEEQAAAIITRHAEPNERLRKAAENALEKVFNGGTKELWAEIQISALDELRAALSTPPQKELRASEIVVCGACSAMTPAGDWKPHCPNCGKGKLFADNPLSESEVSK